MRRGYPGKRRFVANRRIEDEIERLSGVRDAGAGPAATAALRKALADRIGLVIAKAAKVAAELNARELLPDLVEAFDRMLEKPVERDPQCWAKNAIAKALTSMDHRESAVYLWGARHVQMEPVWGGQEDTATTLRGICLLGLVTCSDVRREAVFRVLVDGLADPARDVRAEAARAVAELGGDEAPLLLRLKARTGDRELPVVGQVFDCLLQIEGAGAVPFLGDFLRHGSEDMRSEAALALGSSRLPEAVEALEAAWEATRDPDLRYTVARAISAARQERGFAFLLHVVKNGRAAEAQIALEALTLHRESAEIWRRVEETVGQAGTGVQEAFRNLAARRG
jgi:HEAT repeats